MPSPAPRRFVIVDGSTICEARDRQEETRPRKRQRVQSDAADDVHPDSTSRPPVGYTRDPDYYKGEVVGQDEHVICVEKTLFKLSALTLERFPQLKAFLNGSPDGDLPPTSDDSPLEIFVNASLEEFRALMWAIHASDAEINSQPREYSDVDRILLVAPIARAFKMSRYQHWAMDIITRAADDDVFMDSCSSATLTKLVEVADRCQHPEIISTVARKWKARVLNKKAPSVPALQIAEKYNLTELRGTAYYVHLQDMLDWQTTSSDGVVTQLRADPKLNNGQVMRLLSGYWSLVSFWERFRLSPTKIACSKDCSAEQHRTCTSVWEKRWVSAVGWKRILGHNSADVLNLLACLRDQLSGDEDLKQGLNASCRLAALDELKSKSENIKDNLAAHFVGCV